MGKEVAYKLELLKEYMSIWIEIRVKDALSTRVLDIYKKMGILLFMPKHNTLPEFDVWLSLRTKQNEKYNITFPDERVNK